MHAFDAPMTARRLGDAVDIDWGRTDEVAGFRGGAIGMLDMAVDLDEGLDAGEAGLAWIAARRSDPVDLAGGHIGACLDAAVALFDGGLGDEFGVGGVAKIVGDLGFEIGLIALEGEQIFGLMGHDRFGDVDLAAHGIDGDQRPFQLVGLGEVIEQIRDGGDFVGFLRYAQLRERQPRRGRVGAERVQGFEPPAPIMGPSGGLAVDGDELMSARPLGRNPVLEAARKQRRIDPVEEAAQPALTGDAVMVVGEAAQEVEIMLPPLGNLVEIVTGRDRRAGHQQQHLLQRVHHPPGFAAIVEIGKMLQKHRKPCPRRVLLDDPSHDRTPSENQSDHGITARASTQNPPENPVNLTSGPCRRSPPPLNSGRRSDIRAPRLRMADRAFRGPAPASRAHLGIYLQYIKGLVMSDTFDQVATIIAETCDIPRDTITPESHAIDDLGIDSLDFLDIAFAIDKAFGIKLPLEKWTQEVNDGKATTEQYFVLKNLSARIDELVAAKGA